MAQQEVAVPQIKTIVLIGLLLAGISIVWTIYAGKDLNWDLLNYHIYSAKNFLENRLDKDFMAGGWPSYQNGLPYVPFYLLVLAKLPAIYIGILLAIVHSINLLLIYLISCRCLAYLPSSLKKQWLISSAVVIAAICPVFLVEIGTSFADISTSIPILSGVFLLLGLEPGESRLRKLLIVGIVLGIAPGLKLTNAIYVLLAPLLLRFEKGKLLLALTQITILFAGSAIGFLIADGYWAWELVKEFGNPFFPMFNGIFHSPDFPDFSYKHYRFLSTNLWDGLTFPLRLVVPKKNIYTETAAPDIRYIIFLVTTVIFFMRKACVPNSKSGSILTTLLLRYCIGAFVLWEITTSNGRYIIPLGLLLGPAIVLALAEGVRHSKSVNYLIVSLIGLQSIQVSMAMSLRWNPTSWDGQWFNISVPKELAETPYLYISVDHQSYSFLSMFLPDDSRYMNIKWVALDPDGPGKERIKHLFDEYRGHVRMLRSIGFYNEYGDPMIRSASGDDAELSRFGLKVLPKDCSFIWSADSIGGTTISGLPSSFQPIYGQHGSDGRGKTALMSCAVVEDADARLKYLLIVKKTSGFFTSLEKKCPHQFNPPGRITELVGATQQRFYVNTDFSLSINAKGNISYSDFFSPESHTIGNTANFDEALLSLDCENGPIAIPGNLSISP